MLKNKIKGRTWRVPERDPCMKNAWVNANKMKGGVLPSNMAETSMLQSNFDLQICSMTLLQVMHLPLLWCKTLLKSLSQCLAVIFVCKCKEFVSHMLTSLQSQNVSDFFLFYPQGTSVTGWNSHKKRDILNLKSLTDMRQLRFLQDSEGLDEIALIVWILRGSG